MKPLKLGLFLLVLLPGIILAQDDETDDGAVTEQAAGEDGGTGTGDADDRAAEIDELEPGVPSQVLAADAGIAGGTRGVMDELDLGTTEVTGNQELPKVMYIVPWRESDPGDLMGRPANSLLDDVLAPLDRGEFVREVDYYRDLFDESAEQ